jgi:uncharacterized protein YndB with AHSA1/START domain
VPDLIHRELNLRHDLAEVWRAVTDPAWLARWLADAVTLEPWPGGDATFQIGDETRSGWVEEILAPAPATTSERRVGRLSFWWQPPGAPASRVSIEARETADGTSVCVDEARPLEILDLVGMPLDGGGSGLSGGGGSPVLVAT